MPLNGKVIKIDLILPGRQHGGFQCKSKSLLMSPVLGLLESNNSFLSNIVLFYYLKIDIKLREQLLAQMKAYGKPLMNWTLIRGQGAPLQISFQKINVHPTLPSISGNNIMS